MPRTKVLLNNFLSTTLVLSIPCAELLGFFLGATVISSLGLVTVMSIPDFIRPRAIGTHSGIRVLRTRRGHRDV